MTIATMHISATNISAARRLASSSAFIAAAMFTAGLCLAPIVAMAAPAGTSAPANMLQARISDDGNIRYTVRKGDTLFSLAKNYLISPNSWREIQKINRVRDPYRLAPQSTLIFPARLLRKEPLTARILSFKGTGEITPPTGSAKSIAVGQSVVPGSVVETGRASFLTLQLSNGSRLSLPSQTRLRVKAINRYRLNNMVDVDFLLEKGRVATEAAPLGKSGGRYRVQTPIAVSAVRGTTFRVSYEGPDKASLTEVVEGVVHVNAATSGNDALLEKGFGSAVSPPGSVAKQALLPAPELLAPGKVQVDPQVVLNIAAMTKASGYHVQIARDAGFVEMEQEGYSAEPVLRFDNIANGQWFIRVTALAADGMEGMPQNYAMKRKLTSLSASSDRNDDGGYRFRWAGEGDGKRIYHFRLRPDKEGAAALVDEPGLSSDTITLSDLPPGKYLWSVGVQQFDGNETTSNWLAEQSLIIAPEKPGAS